MKTQRQDKRQMAELLQPVIPGGCWRRMKKWGATLVIYLLPFAMPLAVHAAPTLSVGSVAGSAGTAVDLPVTFNPGTDSVASIQFDLTLPPSLSTLSVTAG